MDDITTRLRRWTHAVDAVPASDLMDEAAAEVERLRWRLMTLESAARYAEGRRVTEPLPECVSGSGTVTPVAQQEKDEKRAVWPTNHDAVPEAIADSTHERPPNVRCQQAGESRCAASGSGSGTGETLSEAELDALQHVVEDGRLVDLSDYGRLRSLLVRLRPEWEGTTPPRNARDHQRRGEDDD